MKRQIFITVEETSFAPHCCCCCCAALLFFFFWFFWFWVLSFRGFWVWHGLAWCWRATTPAVWCKLRQRSRRSWAMQLFLFLSVVVVVVARLLVCLWALHRLEISDTYVCCPYCCCCVWASPMEFGEAQSKVRRANEQLKQRTLGADLLICQANSGSRWLISCRRSWGSCLAWPVLVWCPQGNAVKHNVC